jgi:protein-L-isoaspartate(D-aspartate) O-methyltransferase
MTAATAQVPDALTGQLAPGGRLILPVGVDRQRLLAVTRTETGLVEESLDEVKFVPMLAGTTT